jgi:hypothetical protein
MLLSLRKTLLVVIMALALLAGLLGWSARMSSMPNMYHHSTIQSTHTLADGPNFYCLPPPKGC